MMYDAEDKYADIIRLPHHVSRKHPQMSMALPGKLLSPPLPYGAYLFSP